MRLTTTLGTANHVLGCYPTAKGSLTYWMAETHEFCLLSFRPTLVKGGVGFLPPHEVMTPPRQRVWARGLTSSMYPFVLPVVAMLATPGWVSDSQQGSDCRRHSQAANTEA